MQKATITRLLLLATPIFKEAICDFLVTLEVKADETSNPIDNVVVDILQIFLNCEE